MFLNALGVSSPRTIIEGVFAKALVLEVSQVESDIDLRSLGGFVGFGKLRQSD